jgi:Nicotinamide mononucleotide transporter
MAAALSYYGLDWFGMLTSFLAVYLLGNKKRSGFAVFMVSNLSWVGIGILTNSIAITFGNVIFFGLNLRGYLRWRPEPAKVPA